MFTTYITFAFVCMVFMLVCGFLTYCNFSLQRSIFMEIERMRRFIVEHSKLFANYETESETEANMSE